MSQAEDKSLLEGYLSGDPILVDSFTGRFYRKVYSLALKMLNDQSEAKDVTQDTFLTVFEKASKFRYQSSLQTWILTIAYNNCLKTIKHSGKMYFTVTESNFNVADDLYEEENFQFKKEVFSEAYALLEDTDKLYLELFYLNECSIKDMTIIMDKSESAVKTGLSRARNKIKSLIKESNERV